MIKQLRNFDRARAWRMVLLLPTVIVLAGCDCLQNWVFSSEMRTDAGKPFRGKFIGRAEKGELYSYDGEVFPVLVLAAEKVTTHQIAEEGTEDWVQATRPKLILVDRYFTTYPLDRYVGKKLAVTGTLHEEYPCPHRDGPRLFPPPQKSGRNSSVISVEKIKVID